MPVKEKNTSFRNDIVAVCTLGLDYHRTYWLHGARCGSDCRMCVGYMGTSVRPLATLAIGRTRGSLGGHRSIFQMAFLVLLRGPSIEYCNTGTNCDLLLCGGTIPHSQVDQRATFCSSERNQKRNVKQNQIKF